MINNEDEFRTHDHIDRDIIHINKDGLLLRLQACAASASAASNFWGLLGIAIALLSAGLLTETFHPLFMIPGETFRAIFLLGGIACSILAVISGTKWYQQSDENRPENIVARLATAKKPQAPLALLEAPKSETPTIEKAATKRRRQPKASIE